MKYPKLCNWVLLKKQPDGTYLAKDCIEQVVYTLDARLVAFARRLDGKTDPADIFPDASADEVQSMLNELGGRDLLRYGRVVGSSFGSVIYSLIIPRRTRARTPIPRILNLLLMLLWLPVLLIGFQVQIETYWTTDSLQLWLGIALGLLTGVPLHETAHAVATLGYGGRFLEAGVLLQFFMPGAYIMRNDDYVKKPLHRAQILAAGAETNLMLCGIFLWLSYPFPQAGCLLFSAGICNLLMGTANLTLVNGLDGAKVLGVLMGCEDICQRAKDVLRSKQARRSLCRCGVQGIAELGLCICLRLCQLLLPVFYLVFIAEIVSCFI